jgi:signal transduction histidine kinase
MRARDRIWQIAGSWRGDVVVAIALIALLLVALGTRGLLHGAKNLLETGWLAGACACIVARRAHPQLAAFAAAVCLMVAGLAGSTSGVAEAPGALGSLILVPIFMLAYSLGVAGDLGRSLFALLILSAGVQLLPPPQFNPFVVVVTIGPWAVGLVVRSRRHHTEQLALRGRELEAERELFAAQAVRYERARIARELHDIVAHCVSVMVIQASAGQRLTPTDPSLAAEAFDSIGEVAQQAEAEIGRMVELLDHDQRPGGADGLRLIGELVARAGAAGLAVSCRFTGSTESLPDQAADAAYRVVQESLTNAFKHAPGAPVDVVITASFRQVEIGVVNGPPAGPLSGLEQAGTGRGLAGMRERVAACGGEVTAGPVYGGGWQVHARLPCVPP